MRRAYTRTRPALPVARDLIAAGLTQKDAAAAVGLSPQTLAAHGVRPDDATIRARLVEHARGLNKVWDRESILAAINAWTVEHGTPPTAMDWNPSMARARGRNDRARRHAEGDWPFYSTVVAYFGSWTAALQAAGWTGRPVGYSRPPVTA
jgi:hypothetical protein